ncbi:BZ3500_MvSof-1268-A1-R1_Chr8-2g10261 [Microbotryum saponariae]|uniref:BZ3500_MvSof-1268-A1-R1_Chr8-2g10261 protein n=1 Tax=Microbotryum saponariae TaxID=289078 RepID=A0A2X0KRN7_9BASI|nr:BZ3500_MvSof-1268-A1-R1_Chr8-2g10261 [Microbotryum saponariae]SDA02059.1 BZ3501_MvSof-1269-A2-R1_Chr8-2g10011 [Microbotryum saponariae]
MASFPTWSRTGATTNATPANIVARASPSASADDGTPDSNSSRLRQSHRSIIYSATSAHSSETTTNNPSPALGGRRRRSFLRLLVGVTASALIVSVLLVSSSRFHPHRHDELFRTSTSTTPSASASASRGHPGQTIDATWLQLTARPVFDTRLNVIPASSRNWDDVYLSYRHHVLGSVQALGNWLTPHLLDPGHTVMSADQVYYVEDFDGDDDVEVDSESVVDGAWSNWSESAVFVEATQAMYASRPASFGPHILLEPLQSYLYPITAFADTDMRACNLSSTPDDSSSLRKYPTPPRQGWIALIERGGCPFSNKVRFAQERNAAAVVFGDSSTQEGGVSGGFGLLTPWSPGKHNDHDKISPLHELMSCLTDDTHDIRIPSTFVSRASYLSILRTWQDVQDGPSKDPQGLLVTLSKDELFAWPLLDLLVLILFLPSLLTLLTVFTQRLRMIRQRRLDRAPRDVVAKLPVFLWGDTEKGPQTMPISLDEEQAIGSSSTGHPIPTESTPLLDSSSSTTAATPRPAYLKYLPDAITRRIRRPNPSSTALAPRRRSNLKFRPSNECSICLSDFENGDAVMELPCGHLFHKEEIESWLLESKRVCPICRASITAEDGVEEESPVDGGGPSRSRAQTVDATTQTPAGASPPLAVPSDIIDQERTALAPIATGSSVTLEFVPDS